MDAGERRQRLIEALVGDTYREQYETSPKFHADIHTLAGTLELMVDAIAVNADQAERDMAALVNIVTPVRFA